MNGIFGNGGGDPSDLTTQEKSFTVKEYVRGEPLYRKRAQWGVDGQGSPVRSEQEECVRLECGHVVNPQREIGPDCPVCGRSMCNECKESRLCIRCWQRVHQGCVWRLFEDKATDKRFVVCKRCRPLFIAERTLVRTGKALVDGLKWLFRNDNSKL
jgi:hypothetical protein